MTEYTPMEVKAARALNKRFAEKCSLSEEKSWQLNEDDYLFDARVILNAAGVVDLTEALTKLVVWDDGNLPGDLMDEAAGVLSNALGRALPLKFIPVLSSTVSVTWKKEDEARLDKALNKAYGEASGPYKDAAGWHGQSEIDTRRS